MSENTKAAEAARFAADRRADYGRALKEEREGLQRAGKTDRVKQVDAELKRVQSVKGRTTDADGDEA